MTDYPFTPATLTAGLRRYLDAPGLKLLSTSDLPRPAVFPGIQGEQAGWFTLRPFSAQIQMQQVDYWLAFTLKQGDIACEHEIHHYEKLLYMPILIPNFVAADSKQGWIVLETIDDLRPADQWTIDDYREAVDNLALLHDRFWGLSEDLDNFTKLAQPLARDYEKLCTSGQQSGEKLLRDAPLPDLITPRYKAALENLIQHLEEIAAPLKTQPFTLLHGDYWADNIARPLDGRQMVTHWQFAAIAPAIIDVIMFHQQTRSHLTPSLPLEAAIARYRAKLDECLGKPAYKEEEWALLWDHALLWVFAVRWLKRLAELPAEKYDHPQFSQHWLEPVVSALERRLRVPLPA